MPSSRAHSTHPTHTIAPGRAYSASLPAREKMHRWRFVIALVTIMAIGFRAGNAGNLRPSGLPFVKSKVPVLFSDRKISGLQKLDGPHLQGIPDSFLCDTCMNISTFAEQVLTDPDTTSNILDYVNGILCKSIPGLRSECLNLAEKCVPSLVETLRIYAAPNKLCGETKLCPSAAMLLLNDAWACKMCREFATKALAYAHDSKTETEILDALHAQCAKIGDFSPRCNMLVDIYVPLYISKLDSTTTPEQVCQRVGICSSQSIRDPSSCATCQFAVYQLKAKLQNPLVQEKMMQTHLDECTKVPAHIDQCKDFVAEYGRYILVNLDTSVNTEIICTEINA